MLVKYLKQIEATFNTLKSFDICTLIFLIPFKYINLVLFNICQYLSNTFTGGRLWPTGKKTDHPILLSHPGSLGSSRFIETTRINSSEQSE